MVENLIDMGFTREQAVEAMKLCNDDQSAAAMYLATGEKPEIEPMQPVELPLRSGVRTIGLDLATGQQFISIPLGGLPVSLQGMSTALPTLLASDSVNDANDEELQKAMADSMKDLDEAIYEPMNPEQRQREEGIPVGLKNIGDTLFLNSLIQAMFSIPTLYQEVMNYSGDTASHAGQLVDSLRQLFGFLAISNRKYADPAKVFNSLQDDYGRRITLGRKMGPAQIIATLVTQLIIANGSKEPSLDKQSSVSSEEDALPELRRAMSSTSAMESAIEQVIQGTSLLSRDFFGKVTEFERYIEANGEEKENVITSPFGFFVVDLNQRDLYSAMDQAFHKKVADFVTPTGLDTTAEKEVWLEQCPKVLTFSVKKNIIFQDYETSNLGNFIWKMYMTYDCGYGPQNQWFGIRNSDQATCAIYDESDAAYLEFIQIPGEEPTESTYYIKALGSCEEDDRWLGPSENDSWIYARYTDLKDAAQFTVYKQNFNNTHDPTADGPQYVLKATHPNLEKGSCWMGPTNSGHWMKATYDNIADAGTFKLALSHDPKSSQHVPKTKFSIPKVLYADRFIIQNREVAVKLRQQVLELEKKARDLEETLEQYTNYNGNTESLEASFFNAMQFLNDQICGESLISGDSGQAQAGFALLSQLSDQSGKTVEELTAKLNECNTQIDKIWSHPEMTKTSYDIQTVLVHENHGGSEQYYAYIHNFNQNQWYKYRDMTVEAVKEDEVFNPESQILDYCLIYTSEPGTLLDPAYGLHDLNSAIEQTFYSQQIPEPLIKEVIQDNKRLVAEVMEYKSADRAKDIQNLYIERYGKMEANASAARTSYSSKSTVRYELVNFPVFLFKNYINEKLGKQVLLDMCIRELDLQNRSLADLDSNDALRKKLQGLTSSRNLNFPPTLTLTHIDQSEVSAKMQEFVRKRTDAHIVEFMYKSIYEGKFVNALYSIVMINQRKGNASNEYFYDLYDLPYMVQLASYCSALRNFAAKKVDSGISDLKLTLSIASILDISPYSATYRWIALHAASLFEWAIMTDDLLNEQTGDEFQTLISAFTDRQTLCSHDSNEFPEELMTLISECEQFDPYTWYEGWKSTDISHRFAQSKVTYKAECKDLLEFVKSIKTTTYKMSESQLKTWEERLNIVLPN